MPPHSLVLLPCNLHLSLFRGAAGFIDAAASCPLVPPADCHNASHCTAAASCPIDDSPPLVCKRLPSRRPLVCQLVVVSPLLSRRHRLSFFQHAASTSCPLDTQPALQRAASALQHSTASCHLALLLLFASLLTAGSHISTRRAADRRLKCPSSTPAFIHTGWLLSLISLHCFRLLSSHQHRRLLMRWLLTSHLVCLSFAQTGCLCV